MLSTRSLARPSGLILAAAGLLVLAEASAAGAQHAARTPLEVDSPAESAPTGPNVATEGDLTAVLFEDDATQRVFVAVSDGRALEFAAPVRVDDDPSGASKAVNAFPERSEDLILIRGDSILTAWGDQRNSGAGGVGGSEGADVYFSRSDDAGATFGANVWVPKGYAPGGTVAVLSHAMAASSDGAHVYVLQVVDPNFFGGSQNELWLAASHDGGNTFDPAVQVDVDLSLLFNATLAVDGTEVHVLYNGNATGSVGSSADVFHRRSTDGGATFEPPLQLDLAGSGIHDSSEVLRVALNGDTVAAAWLQDPIGGAFGTQVFAAVSTDGGKSFAAPVEVGADGAGGHFTLGPDLALAPAGEIVVAWSDDRDGTFPFTKVFASTSTDDGATWSSPATLSGTVSNAPYLALSEDDVVALWWSPGTDLDKNFESAFTRDAGATWSAPIALSGPHSFASGGGLQHPTVAFNPFYANALFAWLGDESATSSARHVYAGGYRLPEVVPQGFATGGVAQVDLGSFSGEASLAWVVFSTATGDLTLPFGDGRNLGLAADALLLASLANPSVLLATLAADGSGQTAAFAVPFARGTELFAAAVSLDLGAAVALDEVTDAARISVE